MKLRPFLRSFSSTPAALNDRDRLKPEPEKSNRRKKSSERRPDTSSVIVELNGKTMEDQVVQLDLPVEEVHDEVEVEEDIDDVVVLRKNSTLVPSTPTQTSTTEDVYVDSRDVIRVEPTVELTAPSTNVRRRFFSGNLLAAPSVESLSTLEGQLRRNSTLPSGNNIRHRSGSFNPTILSHHRMDRNSEFDGYGVSRERSMTGDNANRLRQNRSSFIRVEHSTLPRSCGMQRRSNTAFSKHFSASTAEEEDEDDWSEYNSLESLDEGDLEEIQVFLPTGLIIDVPVHPDEEIFFIKQIVMNSATTDERLPLRGCLNPDAQSYVVSYVSQKGLLEEVLDERRTLRELKPFENIIKFSKRIKSRGQYHHLKEKVGKLICKDMKHFDDIRNVEVNDFRWRMKVFANGIAQERKRRLRDSWQDRILYQYPPRLICRSRGSLPIPEMIRLKFIWNSYQDEVEVPATTSPIGLIKNLGPKCNVAVENCVSYCAKAIGEETYFVGDKQELIDYAYIYDRVTTNRAIRLVIVNFENVDIVKASDGVYVLLDNDVSSSSPSASHVISPSSHVTSSTPSLASSLVSGRSLSSNNLNGSSLTISSLEMDRPFIVAIESVKIAPELASPGSQRTFGIQMGLFHGSKPLCPTLTHLLKGSPDECGIYGVEKNFEFDLSICNLPRMAKLCIGIFEKKRNTQHHIFWVNANVFDYKAKLKWKDTLHLWNYSLDMAATHGCLTPLRHTISNPNIRDATDIVICFKTREDCSGKIFYPSEWSCDQMDFCGGAGNPVLSNGFSATSKEGTISKMFTEELIRIADRDPLHDLTIQEKDLLWKVREHCLIRLPHLLPRIVDCVDYGRPEEVAELHRLIDRWPLMPVENSLQLLDYAYPDPVVRGYAVRCLRKAKDSVILMYLLQLAQALKHENYLQCDLVDFLLERALNNQHIGHFLFWELKAEMNSPSAGLMYGLIMEVYLIAAPEHLKILDHQVTFLEKCLATYSSPSNLPNVDVMASQKVKKRFSLESQFHGHRPFKDVVNPLKPSEKCHELQLEKCRRMNSKKRPQVLSFENADIHICSDLEDIVIMFKKGDDLRQDRLTLQLLSVMDNLWKEAGLDLRLNVYGVMATGLQEGFIEVVQQAETICNIQLSQTEYKSTAVFRKGLLMSWLKAHNSTPEKLQQAQWEFTQSCAGYTVAAYVLGIGDRHNDNIMVKKNGQMFHIDFGHFLGNFKHKFGIKRERVRLVLSSDFVEVIKADLGQKKNFERFRELCEKAFLTIRRHGCLIISLLAMMISTGLPELSSEQDLNTIRTTLHLDRLEEEAMECFRKDFDESLKNAWTISVDWWFHSINQLRTKSDKKSSGNASSK